MDEATPPEMFENLLILSYTSNRPVRFAGAAFAHEDYRKVHTFFVNEHHVFILAVPLPEGQATITYRLIIDGLWIADPVNSNSTKDRTGTKLSVFNIPYSKQIQFGPIISNNAVQFTFMSDYGKSVYISGSFNNWNPFLHKMEETMPGVYTISLALKPGTHYYCFYENGEKRLDSENNNVAYNTENQQANYLTF